MNPTGRNRTAATPANRPNIHHFPAWETTIEFIVSAYVDGVTEEGTDTLKAELVGNMFYTPGTPNSADVEINDPPARQARFVTHSPGPGFDLERGRPATFTLTRTGGDTSQELTVNLRGGRLTATT